MSTQRISKKFQQLSERGKAGLIAYLTAGDPSASATLAIARALDRAGVDILELGVPFSDPLADGPTIQAAASRALAAGMTVRGVLEIVTRLREKSEIPLVLFTYLNPIYAYGFESFLRDAAAAGADGLLVLDLPPDEEEQNAELVSAGGLDAIRLIAPTTPPHRMKAIAASGRGFIYYVSREGVTGEQSQLSDTIAARVAEIRRHSRLPVAVGFGISSPDQVAAVASQADAVVIGSAIVRHIAENASDAALAERVASFVRPLVEAVNTSRALPAL